MAFAATGNRNTEEAIRWASSKDVAVQLSRDVVTANTRIHAYHRSSSMALDRIVSAYDHYASTTPQDVYVAQQIKAVVDELLSNAVSTGESSDDFKQKYAALQVELARYKDTVKKLAFDLEMAQTSGSGAVVVESAVRSIALEQAAEFVMDWGVPKDGNDLAELCKQIARIPRSSGVANGK